MPPQHRDRHTLVTGPTLKSHSQHTQAACEQRLTPTKLKGTRHYQQLVSKTSRIGPQRPTRARRLPARADRRGAARPLGHSPSRNTATAGGPLTVIPFRTTDLLPTRADTPVGRRAAGGETHLPTPHRRALRRPHAPPARARSPDPHSLLDGGLQVAPHPTSANPVSWALPRPPAEHPPLPPDSPVSAEPATVGGETCTAGDRRAAPANLALRLVRAPCTVVESQRRSTLSNQVGPKVTLTPLHSGGNSPETGSGSPTSRDRTTCPSHTSNAAHCGDGVLLIHERQVIALPNSCSRAQL